AASLLATGQATLSSLLPPRVAALAKGVTTTMLWCRVTMVLVAGLALAMGTAASMTGPPDTSPPAPGAQTPAARPQTAQAKPAPAAAAPVQPQAMPLSGHKGAVNAVAFTSDGKTLATAGADGTVRVWDSIGTQIHKLDQAGNPVCVAFSPTGKTLVAGST